MMNAVKISVFFLTVILLITACEQDPPNPFDPYNQEDQDTSSVKLDPNSIEGLYNNIFKPTCANSGCHDGTFEPDFRTIESSYNTLVYHPLIKNDVDDPIDYRVEPGSHNRSIIYRRLTKDLGGNSGIMPLLVDPDSDWDEKKEDYISNIETWIDQGAKDILGIQASLQDQLPQMAGFAAKKPGSNPLFGRDAGTAAILIPASEPQVEIFLSVTDHESLASELSVLNFQLSRSRDNFNNADQFPMTYISNSLMEIGYSGTTVDYHFKATINDPANLWNTGEILFARITMKDPLQPNENKIPSRYSADHIKKYFSIKMQ